MTIQEKMTTFALENRQGIMTPTDQTPSIEHQRHPYRLGVALSGGGARGFAHAGALMAIEEAGLKPDIIAGVSAGSVIAVLYAAGIKPLQMAQLFASVGLKSFAELKLGHGGIFAIDKFKNFILRAIGNFRNLEDLPIPVYIGATNLDTGKPVAFSKGEIGPRMIASCSIPIVFSPVIINGEHYVDGGVLRNHPAWMIREMCDFLIGINVSPLRQKKKIHSVIDVALRTYNLMAKANQGIDMSLCDVSVETPEIADFAVFDLKNIKTIFVNGYVHMRKALKDAGMWNPPAQKIDTIHS